MHLLLYNYNLDIFLTSRNNLSTMTSTFIGIESNNTANIDRQINGRQIRMK